MRRILLSALALTPLALGLSGTAQALQFTPPASARLHTITSGEPGAQWTTSGPLAGGELSYDSGTGVATLTAVLDVLNYYDPLDVVCPTDAGSNCDVNYTTDLNVTLDAQFVGISQAPAGPNVVAVTLNFETTANAQPDLDVVDPTDPSPSVLRGDWTLGLFNGNPTSGLSLTVLYNTLTGEALFDEANSNGFLAIDATSAYGGLFESGMNYFGLNVGTLSDFGGGAGDLDSLIGTAISTGTLPSFTAEAVGQVYRLSSGDFVVPEPATALLLGGGLALLGARRRSS